ncbi:MAG: hypothetical protein ABH837_00770, partial [bacterium]
MNILKKLKLKKQHAWLIVIFTIIAILLVAWLFNSLNDRGARAGLTSLDISSFPNKVAYGSAQTLTITAKDGEAVFEDYEGTISFSSTDSDAELPSDYTFKNNTKKKAISINGWNQELKDHEYDNVTTKLADNNVSNAYLGVYETTNVGEGLMFCENDFAFDGVTSDENYDLNNFITSATANSIDTYAWITIFGPEQTIDIDDDGRLENTWVDPSSTEHLTFINNLADHLLTNYAGLKGIVVDYIRYADPPASNQSDGDNIDEAEYRVYEDSDTYTDYVGNFAPGNATTIISNVVTSIAATVHGFVDKEIAVETYSAHTDSVYNNWVKPSLGQDYALLAPNIDILVPLTYHIGWYEASWISQVVDYIYAITNPVNPNCEIWPKVQTWQENKDTNWPGPEEIRDAVEPIDYAKVGGLGFYVYDHMSDGEWVEVRDCFDDNGIKEFEFAITLKQLGDFNIQVEDSVAAISDTKENIEVFYGHTNGTLVKASGDPAIYIIDQGQKRHILSPSIFDSRFTWSKVVTITTTERDKYPNGTNIKYPDGVLLKDTNPNVYVLENSKKRHITSPTVFRELGYKWSNILTISCVELGTYTSGASLSSSTIHPNNSLLKASGNPAIYYLHENRKRHILSPAIFESQFKWDNILYVSTAKGE